ncbi:hypothetical protein [Nitratireductor sp. ZSWI3]|uniref:hypothetical protein n=1 Tax=Nitratireductor sp. ZSWI3 TaxID=2966359 RepID=UPI00214FA0AF|nr:hypothetical protein [Nitratireductor sp. ZSWI3]MCR4268487.1 hypothetical protein [Nitratireductor sp. ZSWI3]
MHGDYLRRRGRLVRLPASCRRAQLFDQLRTGGIVLKDANKDIDVTAGLGRLGSGLSAGRMRND